MLSTSRVRELLGVASNALSEAELVELTTGLYALARHAVGRYRTDRCVLGNSEASVLAAVPESDREVIEERAAVLEFDANMPRDTATRQAIHAYVGRIRSTSRPA
jgi:hypothetical protein